MKSLFVTGLGAKREVQCTYHPTIAAYGIALNGL